MTYGLGAKRWGGLFFWLVDEVIECSYDGKCVHVHNSRMRATASEMTSIYGYIVIMMNEVGWMDGRRVERVCVVAPKPHTHLE